ncbi:MAG: hypothetical protein ACREIT_08510 [Tepidisphaeraceae bacterium]
MQPSPGEREFVVADLSVTGEVRLKADYRYDLLEQVEGATDLIAPITSVLWRSPEEFELSLPGASQRMRLRWRAVATGAGIATLRGHDDKLLSLSLLVSGQDPSADALTLEAFQSHLVRELHDTGFEPAFDLLQLTERPLVATINFEAPEAPGDRRLFALTDRCLAAAFFRKLGLA